MPRQRIDLEALLDVALEIVDDRGPADLTLSNVAAALSVRPSALYTHVDGSDGLRQAVAEQARSNLARSVQSSAVGVAGPDAVEAIAHAYRSFAHRYPGQYRVSLSIRPTEYASTQDISDVFAAVFSAAGLSTEAARAAASTAHASLHGYVSMEANAKSPDNTQFEHMVELLVYLCS